MDISRLADLLRNKASSAAEDYSQLANAYPNLKNFAGALVGNIERNVPTQADLESPEAMQQRAIGYMSPMAGAIKAFHGSPHEFDKFDISKIGTGEGAQAFGHGVYLSESPQFVEQFMSSNNPAARHAYMTLDRTKGDIKQAIKSVNDELNLMKKHSQFIMPEALDKVENSLAILKAKKTGKDLEIGKIYETSIQWPEAEREISDPLSEHHLLDLNKPYSEQSDFIKEKLLKLNNPYVTQAINESPKFNDNGDYWNYMGNSYGSKKEALEDVTPMDLVTGQRGNFNNPEQLSKSLNELGIPGSKYLTKNVANFVMFGDEYPKIVNKANSLAQLLKGGK